MKKLLIGLTLLASVSSFANISHTCSGSIIELNDEVALTGNGIINPTTGETLMTVSELMKDAITRRTKNQFIPANSKGEETHYIRFLGSVSDEDGTLSSTYAIKEIKNEEIQIVQLDSEYSGGGLQLTGRDAFDRELNSDRTFSTLKTSGCR